MIMKQKHAKHPTAKIVPILQSTATDCGLACMVMVLQAHGAKINLEGLRKSVPASSQGVSVAQLLSTANLFGLYGRALRADMDTLDAMHLPAIVHWNFNHYVVLEHFSTGKITIVDPRKGRMYLTPQQFSDHFTGIAVEFTKLPTFSAVTQFVKVSFSHLWSKMEGWRYSVLLVTAISVLIQLAVVVSPLFISVIVDQAIAAHSMDILKAIVMAIVAAHVIVISGELLRRYLLLSLGTRLMSQLSLNLVNHLLRLPYSFFQQSRLNDILNRMETLREVKETLTEGAVPFAIDGLFSILIVAVLFVLSPVLAAVALGFYLAFALIKLFSYDRLRVLSDLVQDHTSEERSQIMDTLRGVQTVKVLNAESARLSAWHGANLAALESVQRKQRFDALMKASNSALAALELVVITSMAAVLTIDGKISVGLLFSILAMRQQFHDRAYPLIERLLEFKLLHSRLQRLASIITTSKEYDHETEQAEQAAPFDVDDLAITIRDLKFRYSPSDPWLFKDLNLTIPHGSFIAIKGRSGMGKSTLIKILLGLAKPNAGEVLVGTTLLEGNRIGAFRNVASAVMQDDQLFGGTLFDNISAYDPSASMEDIHKAAELACVHEEIMKMPAGYFGQVGDMGASLSGGQRQRILLARALYRKPRILLLDEGTANLDLASEAEIIRRLQQLGITIVCVAHRAKALEVADEVYELIDGRLVRAGPARQVIVPVRSASGTAANV